MTSTSVRTGGGRVVLLAVALCVLAVGPARSQGDARPAERAAVGKGTVPRPTAGPSRTDVDPGDEPARQAAERDRLTARIVELRRRIADGERSRAGAAAALARAERSLAEVNQRLAEVARRQKATQDLVAALDRQRTGTAGQIADGERDIARTAKRWYANQDRDAVRAWLVGGVPDDALLDDAYLGYVARAQVADVDGLRARAVDLDGRRRRADEDGRSLGQQAEAERSAREALASDQARQRQNLAELTRTIAAQKSTAAALEADEKRLTRVVEQLRRAIERRAADERAKRDAARRLAERQSAVPKKGGGTGRAPATSADRGPPPVEDVPADAGNSAFARLKGQLRLPARGTVTGRFGTPRGDGGATWKGIFVHTDSGADVHAVAAGTVIFADDLRGFGNLLIVDHGGQYLSIYGNNDTLLKRTGDAVQSGDVVSRAGNSSGDDRTGLYFELRFRGRPFDPTAWLGSR